MLFPPNRCHSVWSFFLAIFLAFATFREVRAYHSAQDRAVAKSASVHYLNTQPGVKYVGDEVCGSCHASEYKSFKQTAMGKSTSVPSQHDLDGLSKPFTFSNSTLNRIYTVYAQNGRMYHAESERDESGQLVFSDAHEIAYVVGAGEIGKSYLVTKGNEFFVSPISFYTRVNGWDLSPGYDRSLFRGFTREAAELCLDCHTGQPRFVSGKPDHLQQPPFRFLSISCERCHGPGAIHVRQRKAGAALKGSIDFAIVNPRELPAEIRDDVCAQCHFMGDAQVLRPGKNYLDFRPGTSLDKVVATFSVPAKIKANRFFALNQFEQLKLSRCAIASKGRLGCISCHDPHVESHGAEAAQYFRARCLTCHSVASCRASADSRRATSVPDDCVTCHMPKQPVENMNHGALTDHRILREPSEDLQTRDQLLREPPDELVYDARVLGFEDTRSDLRSLALAYPQVAGQYPELRRKGFDVLQQAAREFPDDAEIQGTFGQVLSVLQPGEEAAEALQKAIALGSRSPEVRTRLANLRLQQGDVAAVIDICKESIEIEPLYTSAYLTLARAYLISNDLPDARETLDRVLKLDPGNDAARQALLKLQTVTEGNP